MIGAQGEFREVVREEESDRPGNRKVAVGARQRKARQGSEVVTVEQLRGSLTPKVVRLDPEDIPGVIDALEEAYQEVTTDGD